MSHFNNPPDYKQLQQVQSFYEPSLKILQELYERNQRKLRSKGYDENNAAITKNELSEVMARPRNISPSLKSCEGVKKSTFKDFFFCILKSINNRIDVCYINGDMNILKLTISIIIKAFFFSNDNTTIFFRGKNINSILLFNKGHLIKSLRFLKEFTHLRSSMQAPYKELRSHA